MWELNCKNLDLIFSLYPLPIEFNSNKVAIEADRPKKARIKVFLTNPRDLPDSLKVTNLKAIFKAVVTILFWPH